MSVAPYSLSARDYRGRVRDKPRYAAVYALIEDMRHELVDRPELAAMFAACYANTLETTVELCCDGTTFVVTGDIPAMWLRDSSAQVRPYVSLAGRDPDVRRLIRGLMRRQAADILCDPYANAFNRTPNGRGHVGDRPAPSPWVWERKFELDSLCYPIQLCHDYWRATGDRDAFDETIHHMLRRVLTVMRVEQHHDRDSTYAFARRRWPLPIGVLPFCHKGARTNNTGMVWSGFRPSDDACARGFHIPANMFAVVVLGHVAAFADDIYDDADLSREARLLRAEIAYGIETYGVVEHPRHGCIYAYETDGFGHHLLMDDANVPSLLSIPYLGYRPAGDAVYQNTRRFVLSRDNPYYVAGAYARGVGSPHTPRGQVWPLALAMQGLTSQSAAEQDELLAMLTSTTAGTGMMHESFHPDDPRRFTRPWFAWANSLFAAFVQQWAARQDAHPVDNDSLYALTAPATRPEI